MKAVSVTLEPRHIEFLEQEKEARETSRSAVLREILDARIRDNKIVVQLPEREERYLTEVARDIGVPLPRVIHFITYVYKEVEEAFEELFFPRREAVKKFLRRVKGRGGRDE